MGELQFQSGIHHNPGRDIRGGNAGRAIRNDVRTWRWIKQTAVCRLARRPVPDQSAGGNIRHNTNHTDPELEAQTLTPGKEAESGRREGGAHLNSRIQLGNSGVRPLFDRPRIPLR